MRRACSFLKLDVLRLVKNIRVLAAGDLLGALGGNKSRTRNGRRVAGG